MRMLMILRMDMMVSFPCDSLPYNEMGTDNERR